MNILNMLKKYRYRIYIVIVSIAMGIVIAVLPKEIIPPSIIIFAGLCVVVLIILLGKEQEERNFLATLFICAFLCRILISLLIYGYRLLSKGIGLSVDGYCYSENGHAILQMWLNGIRDINKIAEKIIPVSASGTLGGFDFWNAFVYFFTGKSPVSLIFINSLASSLTIIVVYVMAKQFYSKKSAIFASILTAFWPSLFYWSIQNLKEPIIVFLICVIMWGVMLITKIFRFTLLLSIIVLGIALKALAPASFFVLYIAVIPFYLLFIMWIRNKKMTMWLSIFIILFTVLIKKSLPFPGGLGSFLDWAHQMRNYRELGAGSAFLVNLNFTRLPDLVIFIPLAVLFSCFAPFPWQLQNVGQILAVSEMLILYLFIPVVFRGIRFAASKGAKEGILLIVYIFAMILVFTFLEGNIGTLFRHRALILPFIFILIGIGIDQRKIFYKF